MLLDVKHVISYGKPAHILFVLKTLSQARDGLELNSLRNYCVTHSLDYARSFNGIINLLYFIELIVSQSEEGALVTQAKYPNRVSSFSRFLASLLIKQLIKSSQLGEFITLSSIDYDTNENQILIKNDTIPLRLHALKQLFIDLEIFTPSTARHTAYVVNPDYQNLFEEKIIPWLTAGSGYLPDTGLTLEDFARLQKARIEYGEEAERFVINYEIQRLRKHQNKQMIKKISHLKVDAGYDIVSFNSLFSKRIDRYIEVKSTNSSSRFFLSRNEVNVAKSKGDSYYLYLVDRSKINLENYTPTIIQNPYEHVYQNNNSWRLEAFSWEVTPKKYPSHSEAKGRATDS